MNEHLISLYIDNELTLKEKIDFVETVAADEIFTRDTCALLRQEQTLVAVLAGTSPKHHVAPRPAGQKWLNILRPKMVAVGLAGVALYCLVAFFPFARYLVPPAVPGDQNYRFVLYLPEAGDASVIGTFSDWSPIPMQRVGDSGYWTLNLQLAPGEYRYNYLIEQHTRIYDPTIPDRETDDFGGENSILNIGTQI